MSFRSSARQYEAFLKSLVDRLAYLILRAKYTLQETHAKGFGDMVKGLIVKGIIDGYQNPPPVSIPQWKGFSLFQIGDGERGSERSCQSCWTESSEALQGQAAKKRPESKVSSSRRPLDLMAVTGESIPSVFKALICSILGLIHGEVAAKNVYEVALHHLFCFPPVAPGRHLIRISMKKGISSSESFC